MRIIEPNQLGQLKPYKTKPKRILRIALVSLVAVLVIGGLACFLSYIQPLPAVKATIINKSTIAQEYELTWPMNGQASIGALGYGVLADSQTQKPVPMASLAKVMTAIAILRQRPIVTGEQGSEIILKNSDVALYNHYLANDGSVVAVSAGEKISELDALKAMLLPSANNMADTLAVWAFGTMSKYISYANNLASALQLSQTTIADASGFSPDSISTAHDLILLGQAAMNMPVLANIVSQKTAVIPVEGQVENVNFLLGQHGVIGIKTGNTDQAGGCYLWAARYKGVTIIGAILGEMDLESAFSSAAKLLQASQVGFKTQEVVKEGGTIGFYHAAWSAINIPVVAASDLSIFNWASVSQNAQIKLSSIKYPTTKNKVVGSITAGGDQVNARLDDDLPGPSWQWRAFRWL